MKCKSQRNFFLDLLVTIVALQEVSLVPSQVPTF